MKTKIAFNIPALALLLSPLNFAQTLSFTFTTIDYPGAASTFAAGINNSGQIVGGYFLSDGSRHGFLYSAGAFTAIDDPSATSGSEATGLNNFARIVGAYNLNTPEEGHLLDGAHGFSDSGGAFTTIDFPSATTTTPHKINDSGQIVGVYRGTDGIAHGFTDSGGVLTTLDFPGSFSTQDNGINNAGEIVGRYRLMSGAPKHGFLDNGGAFSTIDFPGADDTVATDIDNSGDIVGFYKLSSATSGFLDKGGNFFKIAFPNAIGTEAYGINDRGDIVGAYLDQNGAIHGFEASFSSVAQVFVDIRPQSCPNPLNVGAQGILPVAILGTPTFDVTTVDRSSVRLQGVSPLRSALEDVATPFTGALVSATSCTTAGPDGFTDLVLSFSNPAISAALGTVTNGQVLVLTLTGNLLPQFGGTSLTGQDVVVVVKE